MSRNYDNWEKLVGAVLRRENDRQLAYCESFSTCYSGDLSSRFSFDSAVEDADNFRFNPFVGDVHLPAGNSIDEQMDESRSSNWDVGFQPFNDTMPGGKQPLFWAKRIKVAVGVARGLAFLHDTEIPVIYGTLKSDNIILDADFNAKLSGIGLPKDLSIHKIEGPLGIINEVGDVYGPYAAPEYIATGHLSTECDVYSFGVVLVELMLGRRALDRNRPAGELNLMDWAKPYLVNKTRLGQIMDRRLEGQYPHEDAYKVGQIALQCVSSNPTSRPRMVEVVAALQQL